MASTRTKRRKREDAVTASGAPTALVSSPASLQGFFNLPHELQSKIIKLACRSSTSSASTDGRSADSKSASGASPHSSLPGLDATTALSLARASRALYFLVTPLIWSRAWLSRPSALASFGRAITARPQLGRLVKSLHVGPDTRLPDSWMPVEEGEGFEGSEYSDISDGYHPGPTCIATSLQSDNEARMLPHRWTPTDWFALEEPEIDGRGMSIYKAMMVAQRTIDVKLEQQGRSFSGGEIGDVKWMQRTFEAQATFDVYLIKCKEAEQEYLKQQPDKSRRGIFPSSIYPSLVLLGYLKSSPKADQQSGCAAPACTVTRSDLLHHITRPGALTDRFDHPLLLARSGIKAGVQPSKPWDRFEHEPEDATDLFSPASGFANAGNSSASLRSVDVLDPSLRSVDVLDPSLPSTATIDSLLSHLRAVLSYTPYLQSLSLTGFLERALCGTRSVAPLLKNLRSLSLGPAPIGWIRPMQFKELHRLEKLRICADYLRVDEAEEISKDLKMLKRLQWRLPGRAREETLLKVLDILVNGKKTPVGPAEEGAPVSAHAAKAALDATSGYEKSAAADLDENIASQSKQSALPMIEVRLHPKKLDFVLDQAPTPAVRKAWLEGQPLGAGIRRLLLTKQSDVADDAQLHTDSMHAEGREWWERQSGLREGE